MSRFPTEAKYVCVKGLSGATRVRFIGAIPHGKGTRQISIDVHPDLIVKIAAALIATRDCACDSESKRQWRPPHEMGWRPGHAIWHVENPERPMPCIDHQKVIDMSALPTRGPDPHFQELDESEEETP
jgi:hypothetical protein